MFPNGKTGKKRVKTNGLKSFLYNKTLVKSGFNKLSENYNFTNDLQMILPNTYVPFLKIAPIMYIYNLLKNLFDFALVLLK